MILDKHSQAMKLGVLQKIKDLMDSIEGGALGKKPDAAIMEVKAGPSPHALEGSPAEEAAESPADEKAEGCADDDDDDDDLKKLMAEYEARLK